jgi:hypothetical protein
MANTFTLIEAKTLSTTTASITFTSIPQTYTDLLIKFSTRDNAGSYINNMNININESASNFAARTIMLLGGGLSSGTETTNLAFSTSATATANTFTNGEVYFPNYTLSNYKSYSADSASENNSATNTGAIYESGLWSNTAAITSITFTPTSASFVAYSTFELYGIKNS